MATAINRNQTNRPLSQRRNDWLAKGSYRGGTDGVSALRCRKPLGVIKTPTACARLATSIATPSNNRIIQRYELLKFEGGYVLPGKCAVAMIKGSKTRKADYKIKRFLLRLLVAAGDVQRRFRARN